MLNRFKIEIIVLSFFLIIVLSSSVSATIVKIDMDQNTEYVDGDINSNGASKDTAATTIKAGKSGIPTKRAFLDFNTSVVPDTATINTVILELTVSTNNIAINLNFTGLAFKSTAYVDADLATACARTTNGSTNYLAADGTYNNVVADTTKNVTLGATAASNLSNLLSQDYFSVCIMEDPEGTAQIQFHSNESITAASQPNLYVNYTEANTPPTFNQNGTNNSAPFKNNAVMFYVNWSDDTALSFYRFEWNISGSFDNSSNGTLSGTSFNVTVTKNITANPGTVIAWKFFVNDSNNAWNETPYYFLTVADAPPAYNNNGTNNTAPKINDAVSFYVNLSDDVNVSYYRFEWNITGSFDNNSNGTIGQESFNLTVNKTITAAYGARIAWKVYFNDSSNQWSSTSYYLFTVANTNPVINEVLCYNYSNAINCSNIRYRNNLTVIRVNCTDADNQILNVSYNLTNVNDTSILINSNATANDSALFNYSYSQLINDSGLFNLTVTCHDKATTVSNTTAWYIDFGRLGSVLKIIFNNVEYTSGNVNVRQHDWFKAKLNITCTNGECGTINASLDPAVAEPEKHKPSIYAHIAAYFTLFVFLLIVISVPILIIEDKKFTKKEDLILLLAIISIALIYLTLKTLDRLL